MKLGREEILPNVCQSSYTEMSKGLEKEEGAEALLSPGGTQRIPPTSQSKTHCLVLPLGSWGTDPRTPKRDLAYWLPGISVPPIPPYLWARHDPGARFIAIYVSHWKSTLNKWASPHRDQDRSKAVS